MLTLRPSLIIIELNWFIEKEEYKAQKDLIVNDENIHLIPLNVLPK